MRKLAILLCVLFGACATSPETLRAHYVHVQRQRDIYVVKAAINNTLGTHHVNERLGRYDRSLASLKKRIEHVGDGQL